MSPTAPDKSIPNDAVIATLRTTFAVFRNHTPLAIGIHTALAECLPELTKEQIKVALRRHTASSAYLKSLATGTTRADLDGNPAGTVTPEQQQQAATVLKERYRKAAERVRAEKQAAESRAKEAAEADAKQAKLLQLTQKFARR